MLKFNLIKKQITQLRIYLQQFLIIDENVFNFFYITLYFTRGRLLEDIIHTPHIKLKLNVLCVYVNVLVHEFRQKHQNLLKITLLKITMYK